MAGFFPRLTWKFLRIDFVLLIRILPVEVYLATKILQPSEWKHSKFFKIKSGSCVSPTHHPTEIFISDIKKITGKAEINL